MPDCRSANAVINPPIPAPTITARIPSSFPKYARTVGPSAKAVNDCAQIAAH
jgi:hypothetical protein